MCKGGKAVKILPLDTVVSRDKSTGLYICMRSLLKGWIPEYFTWNLVKEIDLCNTRHRIHVGSAFKI